MESGKGRGKMPQLSRRQLLKFTLGASAAGGAALLIAPVASAEEAVCANLDDVFSNYASLNYREVSPYENERCGNCSFFTPRADSHCGDCEMMDDTTNETGWCDSWGIEGVK